MNLYEETLQILAENGKKEQDVLWIGTDDMVILQGWRGMEELFGFEYDDGFGGVEINQIMVVGDSWWLERHEYDGSEWWEYKQYPQMPKKTSNWKCNKQETICRLNMEQEDK